MTVLYRHSGAKGRIRNKSLTAFLDVFETVLDNAFLNDAKFFCHWSECQYCVGLSMRLSFVGKRKIQQVDKSEEYVASSNNLIWCTDKKSLTDNSYATSHCRILGTVSLLAHISGRRCRIFWRKTALYVFVYISVYSLTPWDKSLVHNREELNRIAVLVWTCRNVRNSGEIILLTTAETELVWYSCFFYTAVHSVSEHSGPTL